MDLVAAGRPNGHVSSRCAVARSIDPGGNGGELTLALFNPAGPARPRARRISTSYLVATPPSVVLAAPDGSEMAAIMALVGLAAMLPLPRHLPAPRTARSLPMMGRVDGRRQGRVAQVVRKELAEVLHTGDIRGKRLATSIREMISIVDVDVSPDLRNARVKVSILGDRKDKISAVRWLQSSRGGIRYCMGKRMKEFKRLPEIKFEHVDVGQAVDVMVLIDKLAAERRDESGAAVIR